jgi:hypothetical protein
MVAFTQQSTKAQWPMADGLHSGEKLSKCCKTGAGGRGATMRRQNSAETGTTAHSPALGGLGGSGTRMLFARITDIHRRAGKLQPMLSVSPL